VKSVDSEEMRSGKVGGTVMCQRPEPAVLKPVRKKMTEEAKSKKCDRGFSEERHREGE
jgi:hypothetical protein